MLFLENTQQRNRTEQKIWAADINTYIEQLAKNSRVQVRDQVKKSKDDAFEFKVVETIDGTEQPVCEARQGI